MLAEFGGRDDDLRVRYIVVGDEDDFKVVLGDVVIVDYGSHFIDEFDDAFGSDVAGGSFA